MAITIKCGEIRSVCAGGRGRHNERCIEVELYDIDGGKVVEDLINQKLVRKIDILELIGEDFARKYWGFEEVEDE